MAVALIALAGSAAAQTSLRGPLFLTAVPQASGVAAANRTGAGQAAPAGEPKALAGMLAAQNEVRSRLNLSQLSWSADLAVKAV